MSDAVIVDKVHPASTALASPPFAVDRLLHAPLLPIAVTFTLGVIVDRFAAIPFGLSFFAAMLMLIFWFIRPRVAHEFAFVGCLWGASACLGAAYHHHERHHFSPNDIGTLASGEPRWMYVRGVLLDEPWLIQRERNDPLVAYRPPDPTIFTMMVSSVRTDADWLPISGRLRVSVDGEIDGVHAGDEVEVAGNLFSPAPPRNPGERDYRDRLLDERIRAELRVRHPTISITRLQMGWTQSLFGWLGVIRGWGQQALSASLPADQSGLAIALLLGDHAPLAKSDWERYIRTGVVHVLAISGQHLVILAGFAWVVLPLVGMSRRRCAVVIALMTLAYALLTGARPSAMRAAVMVMAVSGGILLRREVLTANVLALTWMSVLLLDPTDAFTAGCQLSFLCVGVLAGGVSRWLEPAPVDPLDQLIDESRPFVVRCLRQLGGFVRDLYLTTLILSIVSAPLVCAWTHVVSPVGILIGPPLIVLTSIALISGFMLLFANVTLSFLVPMFALVVGTTLRLCNFLVNVADQLPWGHFYLGAVPSWWMVLFYTWVSALMIAPRGSTYLPRLLGFGAMSIVGLLLLPNRLPTFQDELRVTFLAVGHGNAVVIETPDGRTVMYDAGAIAGPSVTSRIIAPYLWHRGISRIDELILSHADLDHINGIPMLFDRFHIGQVTVSESFAQRPTPGAEEVLRTFERHRVGTRSVFAGDELRFGEVTLSILHPPNRMDRGSENARSLVVLIEHRGHRILLTGDLAEEGLSRTLAQPIKPIDVLMSPHHGGRSSNPPALVKWAAPRLIVSSQSVPRGPPPLGFEGMWTTFEHGAITLRSHASGLIAETFGTSLREVLRGGGR